MAHGGGGGGGGGVPPSHYATPALIPSFTPPPAMMNLMYKDPSQSIPAPVYIPPGARPVLVPAGGPGNWSPTPPSRPPVYFQPPQQSPGHVAGHPPVHKHGGIGHVASPSQPQPALQTYQCPSLSNLSPTMRMIIDQRFREADLTGSTELRLHDIQAALGSLGELFQGEDYVGAKSSLLQLLFAALDHQHDGKVTIDEWRIGMAVLAQGSHCDRRKFGFALIDADHDGLVSEEDLAHVVHSCHSVMARMGIVSVRMYPADLAHRVFSTAGPKGTKVKQDRFWQLMEAHRRLVLGIGFVPVPSKAALSSPPPGRGSSVPTPLLLNASDNSHGSTAIAIMVGIGRGVDWVSQFPLDLGFTCDDFTGTNRIILHDEISTMGMRQRQFFDDIAPLVFAKIRVMMGVPREEYLRSLGPAQLLGHMLFGEVTTLSVKGSAGKSGSVFFTSYDGRFMVKTIPQREKVSLLRIIENYFEFLRDNPHTMLNRILGLFDLNDQTFVVLESVFDSNLRIDRLYDLKGSTKGRMADEERHTVLKDLNFSGALKLGRAREQFLEQLRRDTMFLEANQLIDYSLLVGIHDTAVPDRSPFQPGSRFKPFFKRCKGGLLSADGEEIYCFGVIDFLTTYDLRKKSETFAKRLFLADSEKGEISCVPPSEYGSRFRSYIASICE